MSNWSEVEKILKAPFPVSETKWRVMNVTKDGSKGSCAYYVDARNVMDRLDQAFQDRWANHYEVRVSEPGTWVVECTITVTAESDDYLDGMRHADVGEGENAKDAYSDSLKRAAVHYGIFRYGYELPIEWYPIEGEGKFKRFTKDADALIEKRLSRLVQGATVVSAPAPMPAHAAAYAQAQAAPVVRPIVDRLPASGDLFLKELPEDVPFMKEPPPAPEDELWQANPQPPKRPASTPNAQVDPVFLKAAAQFQSLVPGAWSPDIAALRKAEEDSKRRAPGGTLEAAPLSEKAYGFLCALLDKRYDGDLPAPAHRYILVSILGRTEVDHEHRPGYKLNVLIDWIQKLDENQSKLDALDAYVNQLAEYLGEIE